MLVQAAGSSLIAKLANLLAADALRLAGLLGLGSVAVVPLATGMAITLTLLALRTQLKNPQARFTQLSKWIQFNGSCAAWLLFRFRLF